MLTYSWYRLVFRKDKLTNCELITMTFLQCQCCFKKIEMSLMLRNSTDAHCVPCSPCLNQPIAIQSPIQFVPDANGEREEQQQQHQNMRNSK